MNAKIAACGGLGFRPLLVSRGIVAATIAVSLGVVVSDPY